MNDRSTWALAIPVALLVSCGGAADDEPRLAEFTYDGRCGVYVALQLWRPATVTPVVVGAEGLHCSVVDGQVPTGMQLDPSTCAISGTPLRVESQVVWVRATARNVEGSITRSCSLDVDGPPREYGDALRPHVNHLPGDVFSEATHGAGPQRWMPAAGEALVYAVASGTLPPGLSLDASTGRISGTLEWSPQWTSEWWPFTIGFTASGPLGTVQGETFAGVSMRLPMFSYPATTIVGSLGTPFTVAPTFYPPFAEGGLAFAYALDAWSQGYEARLPAGISLDPGTGVISGTPSTPDSVWAGLTVTVTRNGVAFPLRTGVHVYVPAPL